ncbi:peptidase dimerization domain-containing protein [Salibacterium aidingense]|uniref:peptidase dimerization domain-containing protein n=1 Tax=Salibacterium aidingense TaxID=384933 RepID=UPI0004050353|nr:peptidase dimerization domain-containing protein [Salibacterium aidingense]
MMCHPRDRTMTLRGSLACVDVDLAFHGRSAHAAANPDQGISALDAMIQSFIAVKQILPALHQSANIHGIITKGGEATNVIPDHCEASFLLRAETTEELGRVKQRFYEAVGCSTQAMGASYSADEGLTYAERINNHTLAKQFQHNLEAIGVEVDDSEIKQGIGSSDIGNVSHIVPTIHPYINIGEAVTHTHAFTEATRSEKGMDGLNQSSKALALTAYDLLTSRELVENAKTEWKQTVSKRS